LEEVGTVQGKEGGGGEDKEKKGKERGKEKKKMEGQRGNWNKRGLSKLIVGPNGRGR
jgi:hypothetical protein